MKISKIIVLFFILSIIFVNIAISNELMLTYTKTVNNKISKQISNDTTEEEKTIQSEVIIGFGSSYFYIDEKDTKRIYDFSNNKMIFIDKNGKTYETISLFSIVAFYEMEFRNRVMIAGVFEAGGISGSEISSSDFDIETLFPIIRDKKRKIKRKRIREGYKYIYNKNNVVSYQLSDTKVETEHQNMYEKYLIYECKLHPNIKDDILKLNKVPKTLIYKYKDIAFTSEVTLTLQSMEEGENPTNFIPADYKKYYDSERQLDKIIRKLDNGEIKRKSKEDFARISNKAKSENNYLDAYLALLEYGLQSGEMPIEEMKKLTLLIENNREFSKFAYNINPSTKEEAENSLKKLDTIIRFQLKHGHIIDIVKANINTILGNVHEAEKLFLSALEENPYIAGAYKDLGDLYYSSYDTARAWKCYDVARSLYPDHPLLTDIKEYEDKVLKEYEEFFGN